MKLTMSGAFTSVATVRGVVLLLAFAAVSAPAATSSRTTARLLGPGPTVAQALLMSATEPVARLLQRQPQKEEAYVAVSTALTDTCCCTCIGIAGCIVAVMIVSCV
jgi:hypothetical protein